MEQKLCKCGCGDFVKKNNDYVNGHNCKGKCSKITKNCLYCGNEFKTYKINQMYCNNICTNKSSIRNKNGKIFRQETINKRLNTIKEKYGKLIPWNKGLSKETDERMLKTSETVKSTHWSKTDKRDEICKKIRIDALERVIKHGFTNIGKNEVKLLDEQEKLNNCKIERQYPIRKLGYTVDGYDKENNIVYEVYEGRHYNEKQIPKDLKRQQEIEEYLKCKFVIIKDEQCPTQLTH